MSDTTAPNLTSLSFPSTIDVGTGNTSVTFSAHAEDAGGAGVDDVVVWFDKSLSTDIGSSPLWGIFSGWADTTPNDASSTWIVSEHNNPGTYNITSVSLSDLAGNSKIYTPSELATLGIATKFTVTGSTADTTAPILTSLTFPATVNVGSGSTSVTFSAHAEDAGGAGVDDVVVWFDKSLSTDIGSSPLWGIFSGWTDTTPNDASSTWIVSEHNNPGTYNITSVSLSDLAGNSKIYTPGELSALGIATSFTVTENNENDNPTGTITITGMARQGQTLTAANTLADANGLGTIKFQWKANGTAISGATASSYTLTQAQVGKTISVTASYIDGAGTAEAVTSSVTAAVANVNDAPTGSITIDGTARQGQTLTAANTLADADGLGTVKYQWKADGLAISGATGTTLTLGQAQVGKAISIQASYTDALGTAETVTSAATTVVPNVSTGEYLVNTFGITLQQAGGWVMQHLNTPQEIYNICANIGVSSNMLADVVQPLFPDIVVTGVVVNDWLQANGQPTLI